jgi:hypothetical protein
VAAVGIDIEIDAVHLEHEDGRVPREVWSCGPRDDSNATLPRHSISPTAFTAFGAFHLALVERAT